MNNRLSDERKAEIRRNCSPDKKLGAIILALLDEIDALRERAEAAERRAGERWKLAEGWRQAFKGEQRSHDKARVRIYKLEAALRRCKDCAIDNCGDITAAEFEEKYRDKGADVEEIIPAIVDEALAHQSEAEQEE